ncbi:MAG: type II toxin-antitoxin system death-on-curing family toxin [Planctomycetota bacterium]|jgi:death-on-curing protein|nr:type II toxin-antitoxin system death-on-curing family toxin [Planctomycetota bacterium]
MPIELLYLDDLAAIHRDQIERYGGEMGIRDVGLLESALAQPRATFGGEFLHRDIFEMAAAYLFHVVKNHPFLDGNKRAGAVAAIVFLALNDVVLEGDEAGLEAITLAVACGRADKKQVAGFFRKIAK